MKNILYVENSSKIGGANRSLLLILDHLDREQFTPFVVCPEEGPMIKELEQRGLRWQIIPKLPLNRYWPFPFFSVVRQYREIFHRENIDLIHVNDPAAYLWVGYAIKRKKITTICHVRFPFSEKGLAYLARYVRSPDLFIYNSHYMEKTLAPLAEKYMPQARRTTLYNAVDTDVFRPLPPDLELKKSFGIPQDAPVVGILANFTPVKDHETFLEAAALISRKRSDVYFLLAGEDVLGTGERSRFLLNKAKKLGISEKCKFIGFYQDVPKLLSIIDVVCSTSREEAFGRSIAEAISCGKAVVVSNVGGLPEVVNGFRWGWVVDAGDINGFMEICIRFLDHHKIGSFENTCLSFSKNKYGVKSHIDKIYKLYSSTSKMV